MPYPASGLLPLCLSVLLACVPLRVSAGEGAAGDEGFVIDIDDGGDAPMSEIVIEEPAGSAATPGELVIGEPDDGAPVAPAPAVADRAAGTDLSVDDARLEYGRFTRSGSDANESAYGKLAVSANWMESDWELQVGARIDAYSADGRESSTKVNADYGDSFLRYRGDASRLTFGTQTVIWGRLDELPLSDRVSTADLTRGLLDDLEDRRRANPVLRAESFFGSGKLDLVWLFDFRAAELPDRDGVWYPIDTRSGRILGVDPAVVSPAAVQNAVVIDDEPAGDGGFGARFTGTYPFADVGLTVAHTRQSTPYFRPDGVGRFVAEYPRSWAYGADAAIDAAGATWRLEVLYTSDNPVTRRNLSYTTTPAIAWGGGVEMFPGDGNTRVNLQLIGVNLVDAGAVIDRKEVYNLNGEIEVPFDRERWRASFDFFLGLDQRDVYLNPELAFVGWEPHELYVSLHYLDGDDGTLGGFYEDNSSINIGWRASF